MSLFIETDKPEKIYRVTFREYTNSSNNTVCKNSSTECGEKNEYIELEDDGSILVRENEIDYYKEFGNGIDTMNFVGLLYPEMQKEVDKKSYTITAGTVLKADDPPVITLKGTKGEEISIPYSSMKENGKIEVVPCKVTTLGCLCNESVINGVSYDISDSKYINGVEKDIVDKELDITKEE